ncbi:MAG: class I SAM-dependent methyltransferase [Spirosomataceae bacterium]
MAKLEDEIKSVPHSRINALKFIHKYLEEVDVKGKTVIDLSAGSGYVANLWHKAGAKVSPYDMFPELLKSDNLKCQKIDLNEKLPIASESADYVLLMETIEHIPNQYQLLNEIGRILKKGGILVLTKPNNSNISSRFANLWLEAERSDMFLPNEKSVIGYDNERIYLGRIFLLGAIKLRTLAGLAGLKVQKVHKNQFGISSLLWFILIGWYYYIRTGLTYSKLKRKLPDYELEPLKEQHELNRNSTILFHKHLCMTFIKQ